MYLKLNKYYLVNINNYIQNRSYFSIIITLESLEILRNVDSKYKHIHINDYHFIIKNNKIIDIYCEIIITKSLLLYLYRNNLGKYNNNLILLDNKPFIFKHIQSGGKKKTNKEKNNGKDVILSFFPNSIYRISLLGLRIQSFLLYFLPVDRKTSKVIRNGLSMVYDVNNPLGKIVKFFYGDWFMLRFGKVLITFLITILRVAPDPTGATQSFTTSLSVYNMNNGLKTKINNFKVSLERLVGFNRTLFQGFDVLNEFFVKDRKSIFKIKVNKTLIEFLKPKYIKYNVLDDSKEKEEPNKKSKFSLKKSISNLASKFTLKKGKPKYEMRYVYSMSEINKLYIYLKTKLDIFMQKKPKNYMNLTENIDKLLDSITELLGAILSFILQFDCNMSSFLIELISKKGNPIYVFEIIRHIFKLIPNNIKELLFDKSKLDAQLKENVDNLINMFKEFPYNIKKYIVENLKKNEETDNQIDELIKQLEESGFKDIKDILLNLIDTLIVPKIYEVIDLFYILIPLILVFSIIRSYNYKALKGKENNISKNKLGLLKLQNIASSIWLIEINKIVLEANK